MAKTKQSWSAIMLSDMYKKSCSNNPLESDSYNCLALLKPANDFIIDKTLRTWGDFFDKNEFHETSYNESPSYYANYKEWRGNKIKSGEDLCEESYLLFWDAWDMSWHYNEVDQQRFTELLPNYAEKLGLTILCPYTKGKNSWSDGKLDIPEEEIRWGNEKILSEEDWDKCYELDLCEYTDLVWHEVSYFITESTVNVFEAIDEELEWWNGEDGILDEIEMMYNDNEFKLQALLAIHEINTTITNSKLSYKKRGQKIKSIVAKYNELYSNFTDFEYA